MASLQQRTGIYRVICRFHGKQHFVMIGKVSPQEAEAKAAQVEYLLMRLEQGLIELPPASTSSNSFSAKASRPHRRPQPVPAARP